MGHLKLRQLRFASATNATLALVASLLLVGAAPPSLAADAVKKPVDKVVYKYDIWKRLIEIDYPDGTKLIYTYDLKGNRTEKIITPTG